MKKSVFILLFVCLLILPYVLAVDSSIDKEMQKITHYAEQYESGNIDYVQFLVYSAGVREKLNEALGTSMKEYGGIVKQEQIRKVLGEPDEETRWVWIEREEREKRLDEAVPVWKKIVFDGKKIQIRLSAFPSLFVRGGEEFEEFENEEKNRFEREEELVYRLNFEIEFKRDEQFDIKGKIDEIEVLAENFNSDSSEGNAENLAKECVNTEKAFENYYRQSPGKCEDLMNSIFGSENQRESQKLYVQEVYFYEGDNFEVKARLEMCDECEWNWINLDFWFEGRGPGFFEMFKGEKGEENEGGVTGEIIKGVKLVTGKIITGFQIEEQTEGGENNEIENGGDGQEEIPNEEDIQRENELEEKPSEILNKEGEFIEKPEEFEGFQRRDEYKNWNSEDFKRAIREEVENVKQAIEEKKFEKINKIKEKVWKLNEGWNRKSNEVWQEVDKEFEPKRRELEKNNQDPYWWVKFEQEKRKREQEIRKINYEERKSFYLELFSGYDKREFNYQQKEWEKRLVEEFREFGREICDNNIDDNKNEQVDCDDEQCGGKICGKLISAGIDINGEAKEEVTELYCISGECREKGEIIIHKGHVCGNHILEENESCEKPLEGLTEEELERWIKEESGYCPEDCAKCPVHDAIECPEGEIGISSGKDEKGCLLEPICIKPKSCFSNDDCVDYFLCGEGECVFKQGAETGKCVLKELGECKESECNDGDKEITNCNSGEIVTKICINGKWLQSDVKCPRVSEKICCEIKNVVEETEPKYEWKLGAECPPEEPPFSINYRIVSDVNCEEGIGCDEFCAFQPRPMCVGHPEISGTYPDCSCGWECGEEPLEKECETIADCGGENDVCSNGYCETIVEVVHINKCADVNCQEGYHCIPETGECAVDIERPEPLPSEPPSEPPTSTELAEPPQELPHESLTPEPSQEEPELETQQESQGQPQEVTGNVIFNFIRGLVGVFTKPQLTGKVITGFEVSEEGGDNSEPGQQESEQETEPSPEPSQEEPKEDSVIPPEMECADRERGCDEDGEDRERQEQEEEKWGEEDRERREHEREENEKRCGDDCRRMCEDNLIQPCVQKCIFGENEKMCEDEGCLDECKKKCESEVSLESCVNDCSDKCKKGEKMEMKREEPEPPKMEKGVFKAGGTCRNTAGQREEAFIFFDGWGDPFERIQPLKQKFYQREGDWCKWELENLVKQRREFEKGFNEEFAKWFFEDYLANSAGDWEQHISGIFELYWKNVDNLREIAFRKKCLGQSGISENEFNLINIKYKSVNGEIEFWEELKEVEMPGMHGKIKMISPYMKIWIFPPKKFIVYEMKQAMKNHEFPGSPEEKMERQNQEGPTAEEREMIKRDEEFMGKIGEVADKYGGSVDAVVQFKDYETNEIVFNLYAEVNEDVILRVSPMLPEEVPAEDVRIGIDFEKVYELIYISEKEMRGAQIESPPWDRMKIRPMQKVKEVVSGIKMYFKVRDIINSAEITPADAKKDVEGLVKDFMWMMMKSGGGPGKGGGEADGFEEDMEGGEVDEGKSPWESKEFVTGEIIIDQ